MVISLRIHAVSATFFGFPAARKRIDIGNYHGDYALIESELGWRPRTTLESGLSSTLAFFDQHREYYWP